MTTERTEHSAGRGGHRPLVRVLRDRDAALCLGGVVVSGFGTSALWLAAGVWVKDLTGSDGLAALCMLAMWAPTLVGPALGTLADRVRRRPLLIATGLLMSCLLLTLFAVDSREELWLVYAVLLVYGASGVVHDAAESALMAAAVDPGLLGDFNGLRLTANEGMKLVAPLAGAGLYAAYGGPGVALLDAATFVLAAAVYAALRVREAPPGAPRGTGGSTRPRAPGICGDTPACARSSSRAASRCCARASTAPRRTPSSTPSVTPRVRRRAVRRPGRRVGGGGPARRMGRPAPGRTALRRRGDRPVRGGRGGACGTVRRGRPRHQCGHRRGAARGADRRPDRRPARDAGAAPWPGRGDGQLPGLRPERARSGRGAALVEPAGLWPLLPVVAAVLLGTAAVLAATRWPTGRRTPSAA